MVNLIARDAGEFMNTEILVSAQRLYELIQAGQCMVVDCRFDLGEIGKGRGNWLADHIPGAHYAHLDDDLAVSDWRAHSGRHPSAGPGQNSPIFFACFTGLVFLMPACCL